MTWATGFKWSCSADEGHVWCAEGWACHGPEGRGSHGAEGAPEAREAAQHRGGAREPLGGTPPPNTHFAIETHVRL